MIRTHRPHSETLVLKQNPDVIFLDAMTTKERMMWPNGTGHQIPDRLTRHLVRLSVRLRQMPRGRVQRITSTRRVEPRFIHHKNLLSCERR